MKIYESQMVRDKGIFGFPVSLIEYKDCVAISSGNATAQSFIVVDKSIEDCFGEIYPRARELAFRKLLSPQCQEKFLLPKFHLGPLLIRPSGLSRTELMLRSMFHDQEIERRYLSNGQEVDEKNRAKLPYWVVRHMGHKVGLREYVSFASEGTGPTQLWIKSETQEGIGAALEVATGVEEFLTRFAEMWRKDWVDVGPKVWRTYYDITREEADSEAQADAEAGSFDRPALRA